MKRGEWALMVAVGIGVCVGATVMSAWAADKKTPPNKVVFFGFQDGMKLQKKHKMPTMIHFTASWCGWCRKLEKEVYVDPDVIAASRKFVCIQVDIDKEPKVRDYYKVQGIPAIVFTDVDRKEIHRMVGYRPAKDFLEEMKVALKAAGIEEEKKDDAKTDAAKKDETDKKTE